jgi:hypothetical protein
VCPRLVQHGQLELAGHPAGHLADGADERGGRRRRVGGERPDDPVLDQQRGEHRRPYLAGVAAAGAAGSDPGDGAATGREHLGGEPACLRGVVLALAVPGQQLLLVDHADGGRPEQGAQVARAGGGGLGGQSPAQVRRRERDVVQRLVRRALGGGAEGAALPHPRRRGHGGEGDGDATGEGEQEHGLDGTPRRCAWRVFRWRHP